MSQANVVIILIDAVKVGKTPVDFSPCSTSAVTAGVKGWGLHWDKTSILKVFYPIIRTINVISLSLQKMQIK